MVVYINIISFFSSGKETVDILIQKEGKEFFPSILYWSQLQFGFPHCLYQSTFKVINDFHIAKFNGDFSGFILPVLSAAWKIVDHSFLLETLSSFGHQNMTLSYFPTYFTNWSCSSLCTCFQLLLWQVITNLVI